mgnify:CR=1 FL=1
MKRLRRLNASASCVAITAAMFASPALAQQTATTTVDEIVITGIRASLERSIEIKRTNSGVVDAISAEDIGKLPDASIAESLARIPGLAGERVGGRVRGLSVRGFKEDYVGTTLNGRELLGIGANRGVEYDLYPAEIMSGAVIYKASDASLGAMGIGDGMRIVVYDGLGLFSAPRVRWTRATPAPG